MAAGPLPDPFLDLIRGEGVTPATDDPTWETLALRLTEEGMAGAALSLLKRSGKSDSPPPGAMRILKSDINKIRASQVILFDRFQQLSDRLTGKGIEFIVHKGGALAPLIYDRLEDRPMVDIDILIRPSMWKAVKEILVGSGYRLPPGAREAFWLENYFNLAVASPEDPPASFDLHWSLTQEGRYHIETEELFSRAVSYEWDGRTLLRMSNEDLLLSLFLHLAYHYFEARILWLYDMKLIIERWEIDWDVLLSRASGWGLSTVVAFNFSYLEKIFPGVVPVEAERSVRPGALRSTLIRPFLSKSPMELFRGRDRRVNHFVLGLVAIDSPLDAARFAGDKISRTVKWLGRRPKRR